MSLWTRDVYKPENDQDSITFFKKIIFFTPKIISNSCSSISVFPRGDLESGLKENVNNSCSCNLKTLRFVFSNSSFTVQLGQKS